jgi:plastocyanin
VEIVRDAPLLGPNAFSPPTAVISLSSQSMVTWYNADFSTYGGALGTTHHLKSDDGTTFDSGLLAPNGTFHATFTAPGTYPYHCEIHTGMTGTVTVNP